MGIFYRDKNYVYNGIELDKYQTKVVKNNFKSFLVVSAAGSGKTFTSCARIDYLVNVKKVNPKKILCLSFTNESVNDLKKSLYKNGLNIDVFTFHRFSLGIIKNKYNISSSSLLEYVIDEYFYSFIDFGKIGKLLNYYLDENNISYEYFVNNFKKVALSFINTFKAYGKSREEFLKIIFECHDKDDQILLIILFDIYVLYEEELASECKIDFNDMIVKAEEEIKKRSFFKYDYIIVDEYQDVSFVRYNLIHSIVEKFYCNFMAVGDDYQSIYSFNGTDISLFTEFRRYFKGSKILKLRNTFRNPKDVVDISSRFVLVNKGQIRKRLKSTKYVDNSICVVYTDKPLNSFKCLCSDIDNIMVLSRNKRNVVNILDDEVVLDDKKIVYKDKDIKYLTVHSSKGLESDYVFILNCVDDVLGFPNKIKENNLFKYIKKSKDILEEERRLFYVALTRCKKRVYIFTEKNRESMFVRELLKKYCRKINILKL